MITARLLIGGLRRVPAPVSLRPAQVNGHPALILESDGELHAVLTARIDDGRISGIYAVRNPEKLTHIEHETTVSRS